MNYNQLLNHTLTISEFGFGASPFGNIYNQKLCDNEVRLCVETALENGINYFDVAPYYGKGLAQKRLAKALGKNSQKIILSTKVGRYGHNSFNFSDENIIQSIHHSLELFSRDYLDIVFCHDIEFVDSNIILNSALPTLKKLKQQGKIRAIGISGYPLPLLYSIAKQFPLDIILSYSQLTLINQNLKSYSQKFHDLNVNVINASPFDMGLLTQSNCPAWHPASQELKNKITTLLEKCTQNQIKIEKSAFQYSLNTNNAQSHLTGIGSHKQLKQCLQWYYEKKDSSAIDIIIKLFNDL